MKKIFVVAFVNLAASYIGALIINAGFEYRSYAYDSIQEKKNELEAKAREDDKKFYHSCIANEYPQKFFPHLLSTSAWKSFHLSHNFLPLGSQPNTYVSYCNEGYGFVKYKTDKYGFRNPNSNWQSEVDVLVIGDSFVAGACVPNDTHVVAVINGISNINALTLGSSGNGPNHYFALIERFVPLVKPKHVVLVFYPNDNVDISKDDFFIKRASDPDYNGYTAKGVSDKGTVFFAEASMRIKELDEQKNYDSYCDMQSDYYLTYNERFAKIKENHESLLRISLLREWLTYNTFKGLLSLRHTRSIFFGGKEKSPKGLPDATKLAINILFEKCFDGCVPVVLLLPNSNFWRPDNRKKEYFGEIIGHIKSQHHYQRHIILDGRDFISSNDLEAFAPTGPHLSIKGYRQVAEAILEAINY